MQRIIISGFIILLTLTCSYTGLTNADACAGYTLTVGSDGSLRQDLLSQIMAELIRQRTGTKIDLVRFKSQSELQQAAREQEVDLLVAVVTSSQNSGDLYGRSVKLLKPFGYQEAQAMPAFQLATLKRFPALSRLMNRLAGILDDQTLQTLEKNLTMESNLRAAAKKFLADKKLIFGS